MLLPQKPSVKARYNTLRQIYLKPNEIIGLSLIPALVFLVVCFLFALPYHRHPVSVWMLIFIGFAACAIMCYKSLSSFQPYGNQTYVFYLAALCFIALLLSTILGFLVYDFSLSRYFLGLDLYDYSDILPSETAAAYADAGEIIFAKGTYLDTNKGVGYKDGSRYCVAPIVDDASVEKVQFWAAGVNCCGSRGAFACDDAWNPEARAGVTIRDTSKLHRDLIPWFHKAVRQAEAVLGLSSDTDDSSTLKSGEPSHRDDPLFVRWVVNPVQMQRNLLWTGLGILCLGFMVFSLVCCCMFFFLKNQASMS